MKHFLRKGSLKYPANYSLFVIEADSEAPNNKVSVIIKQKFQSKEEVLVKGNRECSFDKWKKKLLCSVIMPEFGNGLITVSAELRDHKNNEVLASKIISKEYGGGE